MQFIQCSGIRLAYSDSADQHTSDPAIVLLHGLGLDHASLEPIANALRPHWRVVIPDLRGHGASDAPQSPYTMSAFAQDAACLCQTLGITKAVVVGHSMGGNIALTLAHEYPDLVSGVVLIDSALFIPAPAREELSKQFAAMLQPTRALRFFKDALLAMCLPTDTKSAEILRQLRVPEYVIISALPEHTLRYDSQAVIGSLRVPLAYIHSNMPFVDMDELKRSYAQLMTAQTLASGHLSPLEVPEQIDAMLARFLQTLLPKQSSSGLSAG